MMRSIAGVIAGYVVWTVIWLGGNALLFGQITRAVEAGQPFTDPGTLCGVLALSVVCSLAAGATAAAICGARAARPVWVMALLLLATGIAVQASVWSVLPVWYHVTFLSLVVPVSVTGSRLVGIGRAQPA